VDEEHRGAGPQDGGAHRDPEQAGPGRHPSSRSSFVTIGMRGSVAVDAAGLARSLAGLPSGALRLLELGFFAAGEATLIGVGVGVSTAASTPRSFQATWPTPAILAARSRTSVIGMAGVAIAPGCIGSCSGSRRVSLRVLQIGQIGLHDVARAAGHGVGARAVRAGHDGRQDHERQDQQLLPDGNQPRGAAIKPGGRRPVARTRSQSPRPVVGGPISLEARAGPGRTRRRRAGEGGQRP
jgi:hypothetical protein